MNMTRAFPDSPRTAKIMKTIMIVLWASGDVGSWLSQCRLVIAKSSNSTVPLKFCNALKLWVWKLEDENFACVREKTTKILTLPTHPMNWSYFPSRYMMTWLSAKFHSTKWQFSFRSTSLYHCCNVNARANCFCLKRMSCEFPVFEWFCSQISVALCTETSRKKKKQIPNMLIVMNKKKSR